MRSSVGPGRRVATPRRPPLWPLLLLLALVAPPSAALAQEPAPIRAGLAPPPGAYAPGVDVQHYDVEIGLGLGTDWFEGRAAVEVLVEEDGVTLPLDFTGLEVLDVTVDGHPAGYDYADGVLAVPLADRLRGSRPVVTVRYRGVPDDGLILGTGVHGEATAFVDNWPNRTRFWLPSVDHPSDKATVRFTVHAPSEWRVVANGYLVGEPAPTPSDAIGPPGDRRTWVWEMDVPISPYNMVVGAADLETVTVGLAACGRAPASHRADGCVEVTYWAYPQDVARAEPSFRRAPRMVDYFAETFGPYPFEKLANVQAATRFGGMENASAIFYPEQTIAAGVDIESTVAHETAHQWFGDSVTEADWHELWLSEGFAEYFGAQFFEVADGSATFRSAMDAKALAVFSGPEADRPIYDPEVRDLFALLNDNNYEKAAWVLHMLRGVMGDDAFFAGIRDYYARYAQSTVRTSDFRAVMEERYGRDLEWFFHQWIYEPGYPVLAVDPGWRWEPSDSGGGMLSVTVRQTQRSSWPTFRLPMEMLVIQDGEPVRIPIEVDAREAVVRGRLPGSTAPTDLALDPDGWVLRGR